MLINKLYGRPIVLSLAFSLLLYIQLQNAFAENIDRVNPGNFGLPGIIDLPTAKRFPMESYP